MPRVRGLSPASGAMPITPVVNGSVPVNGREPFSKAESIVKSFHSQVSKANHRASPLPKASRVASCPKNEDLQALESELDKIRTANVRNLKVAAVIGVVATCVAAVLSGGLLAGFVALVTGIAMFVLEARGEEKVESLERRILSLKRTVGGGPRTSYLSSSEKVEIEQRKQVRRLHEDFEAFDWDERVSDWSSGSLGQSEKGSGITSEGSSLRVRQALQQQVRQQVEKEIGNATSKHDAFCEILHAPLWKSKDKSVALEKIKKAGDKANRAIDKARKRMDALMPERVQRKKSVEKPPEISTASSKLISAVAIS